jgi:hypothetical protein
MPAANESTAGQATTLSMTAPHHRIIRSPLTFKSSKKIDVVLNENRLK